MAHTLSDSEFSDEPVFLLARAGSLGTSAANRALADLGLKGRHYSVLSLVCGEDHPNQRELGAHLVLDPSQVVLLVDSLEERGLVRRETDPADRRSKIVLPTPEGSALYEQAKTMIRDSTSQTLANLSVSERATLLRLLRRVSLD